MSGRPRAGPRVRDAQPGGPEIVVVGAASRDLALDDERGWRLGGGVTYAALQGARLGVRTAAVIGLDRPAFDATELGLLAGAGVELLRVPLSHGPVFRNVESPGGRIQTCLDPGRPLPMVDVPGPWRDASAWILAPVAGELEERWSDRMRADALVALGWQGMLRTLRAGTRVGRRAPAHGGLVARADLVALSEHDLAADARPEELAAFLKPGAWLVVTAGATGGWLADVTPDGLGPPLRYPAIAAAREVDATGAGDSFLAALVASLLGMGDAADPARREDAGGDPLEGHPLAPRLRFAAAAASFTVEGPGLSTVPDRAAVLGRLAGSAAQSFAESPFSAT
jgi:sugar/nucleoside kinase (ribokinase family)